MRGYLQQFYLARREAAFNLGCDSG